MSFSRPLFPRDDSAQPQLKLFIAPEDGDDDARIANTGELSPDMTLRAFWYAFFLPVRLTGADPKTLKEDRTTLAKWTAYAGERPIGSIDRVLLAGFLPWLQKQPRVGLVTAAKHLARVQTFLRAAGPNRDADEEGLYAEILQKPPRVKAPSLPERDEPDKAFSLREIGAWLDACQHAPRMRRVPNTAAWWQSAVLFDYCCPVRFEALTALAWEWITRRDELPGWWFKCAWSSDKNDRERWYYLSSHAIAALEIAFPGQVARLKADEPLAPGKIFGLPISPARIYAHAKQILQRSSISLQRRQERVFHGLRAAADTELRKLGHPIAAKRALGRSVGRDVDMGFYTAAHEYAAGMEKLPQPGFSRWREPQLRLF